jgi:hypothetical protein
MAELKIKCVCLSEAATFCVVYMYTVYLGMYLKICKDHHIMCCLFLSITLHYTLFTWVCVLQFAKVVTFYLYIRPLPCKLYLSVHVWLRLSHSVVTCTTSHVSGRVGLAEAATFYLAYAVHCNLWI